METLKKEILIGFLVGLTATFSGVFLYLEYFSKFSYHKTIQIVIEGDLYGQILSLAAIPNLFVFFIFIKKKQDSRAKGVLMATFLIAFITLILKTL